MSPESSEEDLPLVTIITPTYNSNPQYLKEAIESVLEQTYPKIEYIITDDGSSVFHDELIHELLETKNRGNVTWKIIRHEVNVGTVKNMNGAIRESHGEYIIPLAHDDVYYDERVIEEWVGEFQRTGSDIITACMSIPETDQIVPNKKNREYFLAQDKFNLRNILRVKNIIFAPATAQSRELYMKYGLYDETYKLLEDRPRWVNLAENGVKIEFWNHIVVKYRYGGVSNSSNINIVLRNDQASFQKYVASLENGVWKIPFIIRYHLMNINAMMLNTFSQRNPLTIISTKMIWVAVGCIDNILIRTNYITK